ncbi:MAG: hypothetical protein WKF83_13055 [Nocardioidaceae bacterium]
MTGIEMLEQARAQAPGSKYNLLLTAYADTDVAIRAINDIGIDYYLLKPWDPPEEKLYPVIDDLLDDWRRANPEHTSDVRVVGHRWSDRSYETKTFLARNHVPYRWYDIERDAEAQRLSDLAQATAADLPLVLVPGGETLRSPSTLDLAGALGLSTKAPRRPSTPQEGACADAAHIARPGSPRTSISALQFHRASTPLRRDARAPGGGAGRVGGGRSGGRRCRRSALTTASSASG